LPEKGDRLKKYQWIAGLIVLVALIALIAWGRNRIHFDFGVLRDQLALADWSKIALATGCIYAAYLFRSARWAFLLRHSKKVQPFSLIGTQVIGFTAVALIGRVADPVRPYLVAKKTGLPLSTQIAVYIVERLFDFGTIALIVSFGLLWIPLPSLPVGPDHAGFLGHLFAPLLHRYPILSVILTRFGALLVTLAGVLLLVVVRLSGRAVAGFFEESFGLVSRNMGRAIGHKIRTFNAGLGAIRNLSDLGMATGISFAMWALITLAYLETLRAFTASPELANMSIPKCILLFAISGSVSVFQLPILGWFSQIALVAAALASFFGAAPEASTACAATLLGVTFLSIIPVGLIWAQFEHVNLRKVAAESGQVDLDKEDALSAGEEPERPRL
jgi:hypothetical protein